MAFTSFKPEGQIVAFPPTLFPKVWSLRSYVDVWTMIPFLTYFKNTVVFACGVTLISLFFDSMSAYAFARLHFPGRNALFILILVALMIPMQVTIIPLFQMMMHLGWLNSFQGLILPRATNAFGIFMLRQFFITLPRELDEAARIDGCSEFSIYFRIILPNALPGLVSLAVFHLMYNWNDFMWPLIMTTTDSMRTLTAGLALFMGQHVINYGIITAGATLALLPLFIAYCFGQRYFVSGIAFTGNKE
ncbi:MAG: carbohydrate ABC transporter permease [Alicyclobacillus sp.]|nr:carbohydrate ABC transporter permease [Alicyclobacillus sp.]